MNESQVLCELLPYHLDYQPILKTFREKYGFDEYENIDHFVNEYLLAGNEIDWQAFH